MEVIPLSWWVGFNLAVFALLALDLGIVHRKNESITVKSALAWSLFYVLFALGFNGLIYQEMGSEAGLQFLTGYLIEKSLSVDNLFVFLLIFRYFQVAPEFQHRILFWGILGALVMRAALIFAGVALIERFHAVTYLFGLLLVVTAAKMLTPSGVFDPASSGLFRWVQRHLPVTDGMHAGHFMVRIRGRLMFTRMLMVLILVEMTDLVFAIDSIPAILAVTTHEFLVYTSNVLALLGLRSLFFALSGSLESFRFLHYGLAGVLGFVGVKMLLVDFIEVPTIVSLGVVATMLTITVAASLIFPERADPDSALAAEPSAPAGIPQ